MLLTSCEKHLSKCSFIIDDDVIILLYCKTSSSTGFENEREFFGARVVAFFKNKNLPKFLKSGQQDYYSDMLFLFLLNRNNQISFKHKNFSSTGFETKSEFFGTKMGAFKKVKVLTELLNYNHISILCHQMNLCNINFHQVFFSFLLAMKNYYGVLPNTNLPVALDLKQKVKFLAPKWQHFQSAESQQKS